MALDPDDAPALALLAWMAMNHDGDLAAAARYLDRALSLAPDDIGTALNAARLSQSWVGLTRPSPSMKFAVARDPVNSRAQSNLGFDYMSAGRMDDAIARWRTALALSPGFIGANYSIGAALRLQGKPEAALAATQQETSEVWRRIGLPMAYHALGRKADSDAALAALIAKYEKDAPYNIACVYAYRGEADKAFAWLDKAVEYGDGGLGEIVTDNLFDKIHADPRWLPFLRKIGKAPEQLAKIEFDKLPPKAERK